MKDTKGKAKEIGDGKNKAVNFTVVETPRKRARRKRKLILGLKRKRLNFYNIERNDRLYQDQSYNQNAGEELLDKIARLQREKIGKRKISAIFTDERSSMPQDGACHHLLATTLNDYSDIGGRMEKTFRLQDLSGKSLKDYDRASVSNLVEIESPHKRARRKRKEIINARRYSRFQRQGVRKIAQTANKRLVLRAEYRQQRRINKRSQTTEERMAMERECKRRKKRDHIAQLSEDQRTIMGEHFRRCFELRSKHKQVSTQRQIDDRSHMTNEHGMESAQVSNEQTMPRRGSCHQSFINTNVIVGHDVTMRENQLNARKQARQSFESFIEVPIIEVTDPRASNNYEADNRQSSDMLNVHSSAGYLTEVPVLEVGSIYELEDILRPFHSCNYRASFMEDPSTRADNQLACAAECRLDACQDEVTELRASNNYEADNRQSSEMRNIHSSIGQLAEVPVLEVGNIYELEDILRPFQSCNYRASFMEDSSMRADNQLAYAVERTLDACEDEDNEAVVEGIDDPRSNITAFHNVARDYVDDCNMHCFRLSHAKICIYCGAKLFYRESNEICCQKGKIQLPSIQCPQELLQIFKDDSELGMHFRRHIRSYNNAFAFTSIGVTIDKELANGMMGVYTFRAQGSIYHRIGSLIPNEDARPRYMQMYIYDTDHEIENRLIENNVMKREILEKLKQILDQHNPYVHVLRQLSQRSDLQDCKLILKERAQNEHQYNLPTASQVAAIWVQGDNPYETNDREIVVETKGNRLLSVRDVTGFYDPLQYPLLLPYGTHGWDLYIYNNLGRRISCREYYSYTLQIRNGEPSVFLLGGRLLQQYVVDNYVKIATQKLRWIRNHQNDIRAEMYQGLQDALNVGEYNGDNVGRRTILPASYVGSPRDMYKRYQDAMALVHKYGKPDLFITMTCNPTWEEITNELLPGQLAQDRPDLTTRIFRARFEELKKDLFEKDVLGRVVAHVHVVEFQKRGLPHAHILLILDHRDKITSPDDYDQIVRAEIPNSEVEPELYDIVKKHMIHGPCGNLRPNSSCMKNGRCKKKYPKEFSPTTFQGNNSYPIYRRRDDGRQVCIRPNANVFVDNRWVVPYNPWLLKKYNCHINVEICSSIVSIKYLYKYVYKGSDRVSLEVRLGEENDEISQFVNARWVCPQEAFWKIFNFPLNKIYPSVIALQVHLPNRHQVYYSCHTRIDDVIGDDRSQKTMLTEFFKSNAEDVDARRYLFREFPEHYKWVSSARKWVKRRSQQRVVGRIYAVSPREGERYYLRILLNHIRGPTSFDNLLTVNGVRYPTFKQVAEILGLLERDNSTRDCLREASCSHMPSALRRLFVTILIYCEPVGVRQLWDEFKSYMCEDYTSSSSSDDLLITSRLLQDLNRLLAQYGRSIEDYDFPVIEADETLDMPHIIQEELSVTSPLEDLASIQQLNADQLHAFTIITNAVIERKGTIFFIDGPGGTGKTFLYRAILAYLRKQGYLILATASSGIASIMMPGGRTAHSRFKIPISLAPTSICNISKQSELGELLRKADALIWDEATMTHRYAFEALDRTLQDIMDNELPFGGKIVILGGDFRQVLPVIPHGTKAQIIDACIVKSKLWENVNIFHLKENMRAKEDAFFSNFLLRIGDGDESYVENEFIKLPDELVMQWENEQSIIEFINTMFPLMHHNSYDTKYIMERAIVTPTNESVDMLNNQIIRLFPGDEVIYYSYDKVKDDTRNLYQQEFLNSIAPGGLPPHKLVLKAGAPIMLLRNLDPTMGLCNGTRLICKAFHENVIDAEIATGSFAGTRCFIPRIPLAPSEDVKLPFKFERKQFPLKLSFALTINKSQGQTIPHVGIFLHDHVFSHGQLYVALSRGISRQTTKVLAKNGKLGRRPGTYTKNIVYKDVLISCNSRLL